jgi:hypothetical protein
MRRTTLGVDPNLGNPIRLAAASSLIMFQIPALLLGLSLAAPGSSPRPETAAEHLYRRGVHCMEVLERNDCAIEKFEALLDQRTTQRALVTDGMLRLIALYGREGRSDDIPSVVRRFWDVGRKRGSSGHVPYSTRFFPSALDVMVNIDNPRVAQSGVMQRLGPDATDLLFSCDEARRTELEDRRLQRRAEKIADKQGRPVAEVLEEQRRKKARQEAERARLREAEPIFLAAACPIARALGHGDLLGWTRMTGGFAHDAGAKSLAVAQIPGLAALLADASARGTIAARGPDHYILVGSDYEGAPIHLVSLDLDELLAAPEALVDEVLEAARKRRRPLNREVAKLVAQVPPDTAFFVVVSQEALQDIGFGGKGGKGGSKLLQALLPRPKGLQVAALLTDSAAVFTRVPTDTPVKAKLLASVANRLLWRAAEDDPEAAEWLEGLDIAESRDRKALLASYFAPAGKLGRIEELFGLK